MLTEDLQVAETGAESEAETAASEAERRRAFRRKLPFGRGAVLQIGERAHIVGVADISVTGAFLSTHAAVSVGEIHVLKLLILPERVELALPVEVVRIAQSDHESSTHPRGVAVRFPEVDEASRGWLERYVACKPVSARR
jgi:Tfp pilus assembly protein PilZ